MKKALCFFLVLIMLSLCACSEYVPPKPVTCDMLSITNNDNSYPGCRERYESVMQAVSNKVDVLEREYNLKIKRDSPNDYFLNEDYILSAFDPFNLSRLNYTDSFGDSYTQELAKEEFNTIAGNRTVIFNSQPDVYTLKFVDEELTEIYSVNYDKKHDSFRYSFVCDTPDGETTTEFLEFITISDTEYAVQSNKSRCYVKFDDENNIDYFICSVLRNEEYESESYIFDSGFSVSEASSKKWAREFDDEAYSSIRIFEDGYLTHFDFVSSPVKEISIKADDYASAFYF